MSPFSTSAVEIFEKSENDLREIGTLVPRSRCGMLAKGVFNFGSSGDHRIEICLPAFAEIKKICVVAGAQGRVDLIDEKKRLRLVAYGSSITHGCAASRPSLSYVNILHRHLNAETINMGFSEAAKGELEVANYLSGLKADIYVLEYDHNATVEELRRTHKRLYTIIRRENPDSFIVMLSRLSGELSISAKEEEERNGIILSTYCDAVDGGDSRVAYIDGRSLIESQKACFFVDDRHPNDRGMAIIAQAIEDVLIASYKDRNRR